MNLDGTVNHSISIATMRQELGRLGKQLDFPAIEFAPGNTLEAGFATWVKFATRASDEHVQLVYAQIVKPEVDQNA